MDPRISLLFKNLDGQYFYIINDYAEKLFNHCLNSNKYLELKHNDVICVCFSQAKLTIASLIRHVGSSSGCPGVLEVKHCSDDVCVCLAKISNKLTVTVFFYSNAPNKGDVYLNIKTEVFNYHCIDMNMDNIRNREIYIEAGYNYIMNGGIMKLVNDYSFKLLTKQVKGEGVVGNVSEVEVKKNDINVDVKHNNCTLTINITNPTTEQIQALTSIFTDINLNK